MQNKRQLIMPDNVVESDHCERQDEGNECPQQAIRLSLLGYIINGGTIIACEEPCFNNQPAVASGTNEPGNIGRRWA